MVQDDLMRRRESGASDVELVLVDLKLDHKNPGPQHSQVEPVFLWSSELPSRNEDILAGIDRPKN